jgi:aldose 1-epimerase
MMDTSNRYIRDATETFVRWCQLNIAMAVACSLATAGELAVERVDGLQIHTLRQCETVARLAPEGGANVFSIQVDGVEYLHQPESAEGIAGVRCGVPVLYPTPNRVKNASFTFEDQVIEFEPNAGANFIHGLVNRHRWQVFCTTLQRDAVSVTCRADFREGSELNGQFPFEHQLFLTVEVKEQAVSWTYKVDNRTAASGAPSAAVPFGFALHPYFVYQGSREQTFLTIPATHWMESTAQLPSGALVPASQLDYPLGSPFSLKGTTLDDVFWGMQAGQPTLIEFREARRSISIETSPDFTHLVVWTPQRPYFGIENQTCSTDAHNLYAAGKQRAAHLQICPAGEIRTGWVEYRFGKTSTDE